MKTVYQMLIFDIDCVISDLKEKTSNPTILKYIAEELKNGNPIALNTGRSLDWIIKRGVKTLITDSKIKPFIKNLIIVGEKGGSWLTFDENGNPQQHINKSLSVSLNLKEEIGKLAVSKYSESMFLDEGKKTAITVEMNDGYDIEKYKKDQKSLIPEVNLLIKKYHLTDKLFLTPNPIAIDVDTRGVGKHLGLKRILDILKERKIKIQKFITIGDQKADFKMAEELHIQGFPIMHVHVGENNMNINREFPVKITKNKFEKGTLEFLKSL